MIKYICSKCGKEYSLGESGKLFIIPINKNESNKELCENCKELISLIKQLEDKFSQEKSKII